MNRIQRVITIICCMAIAFACFYVPWKAENEDWSDHLGYFPIWSPPESDAEVLELFGISLKMRPNILIDYPRVALEIIGVGAMWVIFFTLAGAFKKKLNQAEK